MYTAKEIQEEYRLNTWRTRTNDRKHSHSCVPLALMTESINQFIQGKTPDHEAILAEIRVSDNVIRRPRS